MANSAQKTPIARTLESFAERKARGLLTLTGQSLPASVSAIVSSGIVKVKFELTSVYTIDEITVPMIGSEYIRLPIQVGTKGWVMTADAYLGGMSGLGGGVADLTPRANLSALIWSPIGNTSWTASEAPNKLVLYGPDGAILRTAAKDSSVTVETGIVTIKAASIVFDGPVTFKNPVSGTGGVIDFGTTTLHAGDITSSGKDVGSSHTHSGVTTGGGNSGPPI